MSNHGQINPAHSRRQLQDQSRLRNSKGAQNTGSTQQRIWYSRYANHPVETTSPRGVTHSVQWASKSTNGRARAGTDRSPFVSTDWAAQGGKRLPQKKITDGLVGDRRHLIEPAHDQLSISQQCELLDIPRASYYYQPVGESVANLALMARIDKLFTDRPEMGVRRMQQELTTSEYPLNPKRIRRLMRLMGLEAVYPKPNFSKPAEGHQIYPYLLRGMPITHRNHVWSTDITYIPMANGFLYLCAVIDWYTRFILSWRLSNTLLVDFCIDALQEALNQWGKPQIFNTDQGSQFTSPRFLAPLKAAEIQISMDGKGRAIDNIFIERLWRTVKYEHIYLHAYPDGLALERGLTKYFHFYNYGRKHQSLDYQTPAQWYIDGIKGRKNTISPSAGIPLN